jgi:hypothetical protein
MIKNDDSATFRKKIRTLFQGAIPTRGHSVTKVIFGYSSCVFHAKCVDTHQKTLDKDLRPISRYPI